MLHQAADVIDLINLYQKRQERNKEEEARKRGEPYQKQQEEDSLLSLDNISTGLRIGATVVSIAGIFAAALSANEKEKSRK